MSELLEAVAEETAAQLHPVVEAAVEPPRTSTACTTCPAHCCSKKFGYQTVSLTWEERRDPLFSPHLSEYGSLKLEGRHCRFLDPSSLRCTIYEKRPHACRGFVCHDTKNQGDSTIAMVYRNRQLKRHLTEHGVLPPLTHDLFWDEQPDRVPTVVRRSAEESVENAIRWAGNVTRNIFRLVAETGEIELIGRVRKGVFRRYIKS